MVGFPVDEICVSLQKWMNIISKYSKNGEILIEEYGQVPMKLTSPLHIIIEQIERELSASEMKERLEKREWVKEKTPNLMKNFDHVFKRAMEGPVSPKPIRDMQDTN